MLTHLLVKHRIRLAACLLLCMAIAGCDSDTPTNSIGEQENVVPNVEIATLDAPLRKKRHARIIKPACLPTLKDGKLFIGEHPLELAVDEKHGFSTYPLDAARILIATKHMWDSPTIGAPKGLIWSIPCDRPEDASVFYQRMESDFGHGAISLDGHGLFFTTTRGIQRLFLENKTVQPVTNSPAVSDLCWSRNEPSYPQVMVDIVQSVDPESGDIFFERGSFCGLAATWISRVWRLRADAADSSQPPMRSPHPYATITGDASGQLWAGDGGRCNQPGVIDRQSPGHVFVSRNDGADWKAVPVRVGAAIMHTAVHSVRADLERPGHVVIHAARCTSPMATYGGHLYVTRDAGKSWRKIPIGSKAGDPSDGGHAVAAFELMAGSVDRLRVWNQAGDTFESNNTGSRWQKVATRASPEPQRSVVTDRGLFRASPDGLGLKSGEKAEAFYFPAQTTKRE
jgi:hypothetical protein